MARIKIDYGVDLGTTNSSIARMEDGKAVIKKTDTLKDTLPSCVTINKKKVAQVGDAAYSQLDKDRRQSFKNPEYSSSTYIEFKRTMGTRELYPCKNALKEFSSEELSAEVLKTLKSFVVDETITSIVITVPAKFTAQQNQATVEAGKLAGFKQVELLQEPIAASMAYGLNTKIKDGYWLVFDLGGGTFDAALMKLEDGVMAVKDTEGDNWLGGKDLDYAIVDNIFLPYFRSNYSIDSILADKLKKETFRNMWKAKAEEAKIALSFKDNYSVYTDVGDDYGEDDNGTPFELELEITREMYEQIAAPIYQKAVDICRELTTRNNLKGRNIGALILIGGPTYAPIIRKLLREQITEKIDTSVDPMTAVAQGAAIFASTISVNDDVRDEQRDNTKIQLEVNYESRSIGEEEFVTFKVLKDKTVGKIPDKLLIDLYRVDKDWSSGKQAIEDRVTLIEVKLKESAANTFNILLYDNSGNRVECEPKQFTIIQGITGGDATLPYHIGIEITDKILEKDIFDPITGLEKGKALPATGVTKDLKTQKQIRPGIVTDFITIPIYQGDNNAKGTKAIYNNHIADVKISGESLPALLPVDSPVEITIKIDRSQLMQFTAYFPLINHSEEVKVELNKSKAIDDKFLSKEISDALKTAKKIKELTPGGLIDKIINKLEELESQLEKEKANADGRLKILDNLRKELRELDLMENSAEWPVVEKDLKNTFYDLESLIEQVKKNGHEDRLKMDRVTTHLQEYRSKIEAIIKDKSIKDAKELTTEIGGFDFELRNILTENRMEMEYLKYIDGDFANIRWLDKNKARTLLNQGLNNIATGNTNNIRPIIIELIKLMDPEDQNKMRDKLTR